MSKAFTKEEDDIPERESRTRASTGLPPGAANYMTAEGAENLRDEWSRARGARKTELLRILDSVTIVPQRDDAPDEVLFGTTVTVRDAAGKVDRYRIVGVDEADHSAGRISWVSPLGRVLMGAQIAQLRPLPESPPRKVEIVAIE